LGCPAGAPDAMAAMTAAIPAVFTPICKVREIIFELLSAVFESFVFFVVDDPDHRDSQTVVQYTPSRPASEWEA